MKLKGTDAREQQSPCELDREHPVWNHSNSNREILPWPTQHWPKSYCESMALACKCPERGRAVDHSLFYSQHLTHYEIDGSEK